MVATINRQVVLKHGLTVKFPDNETKAPVTAVSNAQDLGAQDYVLVTVEVPSLAALSTEIAPCLKTDTAAVFGMSEVPWWFFHCARGPMSERRLNLIDPDNAIWNSVRPERAIGAVVNTACTVIASGVIQVIGRMNRLILGEPNHAPSERVVRGWPMPRVRAA